MADAQSWNTERSGSSEHDESAAGSSCKPALDWGAYCRAWGEVAGRRCRRAAAGAEHCSHSSGVVSSSRAAVRSNDTNDFDNKVEQIVKAGRPYHYGLEAGSKPELLAVMAMLDDEEALIVCNGYKDEEYIETALLAPLAAGYLLWLHFRGEGALGRVDSGTQWLVLSTGVVM